MKRACRSADCKKREINTVTTAKSRRQVSSNIFFVQQMRSICATLKLSKSEYQDRHYIYLIPKMRDPDGLHTRHLIRFVEEWS